MAERLVFDVELREADDDVPRLHGVILVEGRAARGGRAELFAPGAVTWPNDGIAIRTEHFGPVEARAMPSRVGTEIRISARATPGIVQAVQAGRRRMSVEFHLLAETRTAAGVREIERALVDAVALTDHAEYDQTSAEVRDRKVTRWWL